MNLRSAPKGVPVGVFLGSLIYYVTLLCPAPYWLDSSEMAAATFVLGVPHPPGHPLAMLVGQLALLLPLGSVAFRVGFAQALCGALGAAFLCAAGAWLSHRARGALVLQFDPQAADAPGHVGQPDLGDWLIGAGASLAMSLGYAVAFQAVRPEVYALHRLLSALAFWALCKGDATGDRRLFLLAAFSLGLGLANHHFLIALCALPLPVLLVLREDGAGPRGAKKTLWDLLLFGVISALGLLLYFYLPLRATHHPILNWGSPSTWSRFWWTITAKAFQKSVRTPLSEDGDVLGALLEMVHPLGILPILLGGYVLVRLSLVRRIGSYLVLVAALHGVGRAILGFDPGNPDAHGYLAPGGDALVLLGCGGLAALVVGVRRIGKTKSQGAPILFGCVVVLLWGAHGMSFHKKVDRGEFWDLERLVSPMLEDAPSRSRVLSGYFQTVFALHYLMGVEGQRPDVQHLHPHFLGYPGHKEDLLARYRDDASLQGLLGAKWLAPGPLLKSVEERKVVVEYDLDTPAELVPFLLPYGTSERLLPKEASRPEEAALLQAQKRRHEVEQTLDRNEPETRRNWLWRTYVRLHLACQKQDRLTYLAERERFVGILGQGANPQSPELEALDQRCPFVR